jgi:glutamine amidotransferase
VEEDSALRDEKPGAVYYAHSFACRAEEPDVVVGWTTHEEDRFPASVRRGKVLGVQFHPEKSSAAGVRFVHGFLKEVGS